MAPTSPQDIEQVFRDQRFWSLTPENQVSLTSELLGDAYGDRFKELDPQAQDRVVKNALNEYRPAGLMERVLHYAPGAGLISKYGYGREVKASPLMRKLVGEEVGTEYGAELGALEDVAILAGSLATLHFTAPGLLAGTAFEGMKLIGNVFARESAIGGLFEVGKIVTELPEHVPGIGEAAVRVGLGAATGGVLGVGVESGIAALRGSFREMLEPAGEVVNKRFIRREFERLYPDDSALAESEFRSHLERGADITKMTDEDIALDLRAMGERTGAAATRMRNNLRTLQGYREAERAATLGAEREAAAAAEQQARVAEWTARYNSEEAAKAETARRNAESRAQIENAKQAEAEGYWRRRMSEQEEAQRNEAALQQARIESYTRQYERETVERDRVEVERQRLREVNEQLQKLRYAGERAEEMRSRLSAEMAAPSGEEEAYALRRQIQENTLRARQAQMEQEIAKLPQGGRTKTEQMYMKALQEPYEAMNGFVGQEPITLPMQMRLADGSVTEITKFMQNQALTKTRGWISRRELRETINPLSRQDALRVLSERVAAEQSIKLADAHASRPGFADNVGAQTQEFNLRKQGVMGLLRTAQRELSPGSMESLRDVAPLAGDRIVGSIESVPKLSEAGHIAEALAGGGFENVRVAAAPEGVADITFTRGNSAAEQRASFLYDLYTTKHGVVDPTTRTYSGLTADEHEFLGRSFGLSPKESERYRNFVNQTLDDMISRGIRVPADTSALGVPTIEEQVLTKQRQALPIRADAIVGLEEAQRFEKGDWIKTREGTYQVLDVGQDESRTPMRRMVLLGDDKGNRMGVFMSEEALKAGGARRDVSQPIGRDPTRPMSMESPARTLEALLNPEARPPTLPIIEPVRRQVEQAAREMGMRAVQNRRTGKVNLTLNGTTIELNSLEDAARMLNSLRFVADEQRRLIDGIGGWRC